MNSATVISLYPFEIDSLKPGLIPTQYRLEPAIQLGSTAQDITPSTLLIQDVKRSIYIDADRGSMIVTEPIEIVATSVVDDFINSSILVNRMIAEPGVFWVEGALNIKQAKAIPEYQKAFDRQNRWYGDQIKVADDSWSRYRAHRSITDVQRYAAKIMNLKREWAEDVSNRHIQQCPACAEFVPGLAVVCKSCQYVLNPEVYKTMKFANQAVPSTKTA